MYKELDLFQRIGFNKSYKEAEPRNRAPFSGTTVNTSRHHYLTKKKGSNTPHSRKIKKEGKSSSTPASKKVKKEGKSSSTPSTEERLRRTEAELKKLQTEGISLTPKKEKRESRKTGRYDT